MSRYLFALVLLALAAPLRAQSGDVDAYARDYILRHRIPSAAIVVVKDGRVLKAAGYGTANLETGAPASEHTVYEIGSISKQFAAEAVMLLVEAGKVALDEPLSTYLPGTPPAWSGITIRQLLTHTSGLPDWEALDLISYRREYTPKEYIDLLATHPLDFPPGTRWSYTNSAFPLLGLVVERASGQPFERFVTEHVFAPAGMGETRFKHPEQVVPNRSGGYIEKKDTLFNGEPLRPAIIAPNGGVMSTAADMGKWLIALTSGRIVRPAAFADMTAQGHTSDGRPFNGGMAWFVDRFRGHRVLLHNGSTIAGYSSVVYWWPDDGMGVVALMNIDRWNAVNVLATRVASFYGPVLAAGALPERPDPDPAIARWLAAMLAAVAAREDSELLAPSLRNPPGPPRVGAGFGVADPSARMAFLDREDLGVAGVERFGARIRWIWRYRVAAADRVLDYTFELTPDGKVARFYPEAQ